LKYKKFEDGEFEVCGYEEANGEDSGTIIWECYYVNSQGKKERFKVRPKGSREFRRELFENAVKNFKKMYLGQLLTVRFQEISKDGCPRFPVGIGIRHDI
jgi:DNA ligase-1